MDLPLYCHGCDTDQPHDPINSSEAACTSCGTVRKVEADQTAGVVVPMAYCATCQDTLAVGHVCVTDAPPCESQTHLLSRCGICRSCRLLQKDFIAAQSERLDAARDYSPSDLDHPA